MPTRRCALLACLLLAVGPHTPLRCQQPGAVAVSLQATVDAAALSTTGRAQLRLQFQCEVALDRPYSVRVELRHKNRVVARRDHAPPVPTRQWQLGKAVLYELPLSFPMLPDGMRAGDRIEVFAALHDAATDQIVSLRGAARRDGFYLAADFVLPDLDARPDAAAVDASIAAALALAEKQPQVAWDQLEFLFRRLDDYPLKARLQKALFVIGRMPPASLTFEEQGIVQARVRGERARFLRQVAGRMYDRGRWLGALLLLDEVGGALQEDADRAVLGALGEAQRVTQDRDGIAAKVFALTKDQEAEVAALAAKHARDQERLAVGQRLGKDPATRAIGRELVRSLEYTSTVKQASIDARTKIEADWLADVPADERAEATAAMQHACWARTAPRPSHRFVLIGPQQLVQGIPDDSLLRFDLAYLYLTDLFGRVPNPEGDRVTVYWKELWEFGGGVGGGKIIDIGNADPAAKATRVDTGLLYHELTHCVDDTAPVYAGLREGLADFGAAFCEWELGQVAAARAAMGLAARAFLGDYLQRDLEYWRMPNYGPSAGFLLHFITAYGKSGEGYRWELYRKFFRDYRGCKVKDARTPTLARAFAFHLVEAFGNAAFADLQRFRWPLLDSDLEAVRREQLAAKRTQLAPVFDELPGSPVPRDRVATSLDGKGSKVADYASGMGVVTDWWVIGPFRRQGVDPDSYRFAPELEIDLQARYESINNNPTWRRPGPKPVTVAATGWLNYEFAYQDDSAIYALSHVNVESAMEAWFHVRADDDLSLFVNDELVGKYDHAGGPLGPWRPGGRMQLPDAMRWPVALQKGRNKVLLKVRNRGGPSGCTLAIAQRNGQPLAGWTTDVEPPTKKLAAIEMPDGRRWPQRFRSRFDGASEARKLDATVGKWRVRNGALEGHAREREVEWRKYTVRPGFPKDSPSNLAWLPEKATEAADAFLLSIVLPAEGAVPKLAVIVQGDGQRDALCGWTLILEPRGEGVIGYLERYDERIYMSDVVPFVAVAKKPIRLELQYFARRLSVRLLDHVMFDQAPLLPIPGKHRIGIATWGEALRIEEIELRGPVRTR